MAAHSITTTTERHVFEIVDGQLTIEGEDKTLTPVETEQSLDVLLVWKYGLEEVSIDDIERNNSGTAKWSLQSFDLV